MKRFYGIRVRQVQFVLILMMPFCSYGQKTGDNTVAPSRMLRIYEDNDFINITGNSTDKAYTNGTRLDYFYTRRHPAGWLPRAGHNSINIASWGITELMITPNDLSITSFQPDDYPYSTALYVSHGLYSYNTAKKFSLQTELLAGIRGPAALGEQTQAFIHRVLKFQKPQGWSKQLQNKLLLNINVAAEKQVYRYQNKLDIIGGARLEAGTMAAGLTFYPIIRLGKMNPYFGGLIAQYTNPGKKQPANKKNIQLYLLFKPGISFYASNGMLQAGHQRFSSEGGNETLASIKRTVWFFNGGAVLSVNRVGISFNQNYSSALMQHLYAHGIGNFSLYYTL